MGRMWMIIILFLVEARAGAWPSATFYMRDTMRSHIKVHTAKIDTLKYDFKRDSLMPIQLNDSMIQIKQLPLVYLPDSLIRDTLQYEYTKIKNFAYKNKWTKELYKLVFVDPQPGQINVMRTQNSEERFQDYKDKTIRSITIQVLPPYGRSVYDTTYVEEDLGWLKNIANKTHMKTAESVIRRQLTIKPGMKLQPFELVQNEILLRQLDYIDDATFIVSEVPNDTNQVNLILVSKDEFSWGAVVETNFLNSFNLGLENKNFFKLGHVVNYDFTYRGTKDQKWGNELEYKANSLWGSHINVRGYYRNDYKEKQVRVEIDRQFLTSSMKWAGGIAAGRVYYSDNLPDRNVMNPEELFDYHFQDVWGGKSFQLAPKYSYNRNVYLTGRFFTTFFNKRPEVADDTNHLYYNRLDYFFAYTYTKIKYYKANLIYDFGKTEDIPTGLFVSLIGGYEHTEFENFGYLGTEYRYSHFNRHTERFYSLQAALGAYINESGFTRGLLQLGANHISNLCNIGNLKFRFYNSANYIRGIRRYPADKLYMQDYNIRGFSSDTLSGNQKISASSSITFFLPYIKRGFRASITTFVDVGAIAPQKIRLGDTKTYWGIGVALNLRNDNVVIKNISFRFSYYPTIPSDGRSIQATMSGKIPNGFYDYQVTKPQVIQYE